MIKGSCKVDLQELWDLAEAISKMIDKENARRNYSTNWWKLKEGREEREELIHDVLINSGIFEAPDD